jgi:hypothetical protein
MMTFTRTRALAPVAAFALLIASPFAASAQQATESATDAAANRPEHSGTVAVARVSHFNNTLVLFDEYDRRYTVRDGNYVTEQGASMVIADGRIARLVGCGSDPCDFVTHSTRVVERRLLIYAEIAVPDGLYFHSGGNWIRVRGGELVELFEPKQKKAGASSEPEDEVSP